MDESSSTVARSPSPSGLALALVPRAVSAAVAPAGARSEDLVEHGNWASNIVEKYNATAQKLYAAQAEIQQVQQEQGRCVQQLQKMAAQNDELDAKQQKMIDELQKSDKDMHEAIKSLMEQRLDATKSEVQMAVRKLDEKLTPKFDGLERGIADISSLQQEIQSKTLPRWRAELGTEIQSLRNDMAQQKELSGARDDELDAAQTKAQAAAKESQASLEGRLLAEIGELKARLGRAEQAAEALKADHCNTKSSLADLEGRHVQAKDAADKRLLGLESSRDIQQATAGIEAQRLDKLERSLQQVLYDFEDTKAKVANEMSAKEERLEARAEDLDKRQGELQKHTQESFDKAKAALDQVLAKEVEVMSKRITANEGVVSECSKAAAKNAVETTKVAELLEQRSKQLEQQSKSDAKEAVQTIRQQLEKEGARLGKLENKAAEVEAAQLKEHKALAESIGSVKSSADLRIGDLETHSGSRLKIIQQAVDELAQMFQEFGVLQQDQETSLRTVQSAIEAIEVKVWPWKGRDRSASPTSQPKVRLGSARPRSALPLRDEGLSSTASTDPKAPNGPTTPKRLRPISARARVGSGSSGSLPAGAARNVSAARPPSGLSR
jgi:chromosome segregation ATPase